MDCTGLTAARKAWTSALMAIAGLVLAFSAQAQEPIKIGFSVSLTGGLASYGKAHLI